MAKDMQNYGLLIAAIVAIVAIVGLVILFSGGKPSAALWTDAPGETCVSCPYGQVGSGQAAVVRVCGPAGTPAAELCTVYNPFLTVQEAKARDKAIVTSGYEAVQR